jgi:hypothetical protein
MPFKTARDLNIEVDEKTITAMLQHIKKLEARVTEMEHANKEIGGHLLHINQYMQSIGPEIELVQDIKEECVKIQNISDVLQSTVAQNHHENLNHIKEFGIRVTAAEGSIGKLQSSLKGNWKMTFDLQKFVRMPDPKQIEASYEQSPQQNAYNPNQHPQTTYQPPKQYLTPAPPQRPDSVHGSIPTFLYTNDGSMEEVLKKPNEPGRKSFAYKPVTYGKGK